VGVAGVVVAVVALVIGLCAVATGHVAAGATAWLLHTDHGVRDAELRWHAENSDEPAPPPPADPSASRKVYFPA